MADNVTLPGTGALVATDDDGTAQHQYIKIEFGADGTFTKVSSANPLPVTVISGEDGAVQGVDAHDAAVTAKPVLVGGSASAAAPTSVSADGDAVKAWYLRNGAQATVLTAAGALVGGDATNGLDVDVTRLPSIPAGNNNIGDVDVVTLPGIAGSAAHDAAVSGNPVLIGLEARTSDGTAVGNGDAVRGLADTLGKQVVLVGATHDRQVRGLTNYTTNSAADVITAAGSGVRIAVMSVLVTNGHATVNTKVSIRDGTTAKITGYCAAVGGGFAINGGAVPLFITTANTAVTAICGTTGADVDVTVSGYTIGN